MCRCVQPAVRAKRDIHNRCERQSFAEPRPVSAAICRDECGEISRYQELAAADDDVVDRDVWEVAAYVCPGRACVGRLPDVSDSHARTFSPSPRKAIEADVRCTTARIRRVYGDGGDVTIRQISGQIELTPCATHIRRDPARKA